MTSEFTPGREYVILRVIKSFSSFQKFAQQPLGDSEALHDAQPSDPHAERLLDVANSQAQNITYSQPGLETDREY
jgi:predicted Zn-dependent protease